MSSDLEALNAAREEGYLLGRRATLRAQLAAILGDLGYHAPDTAEVARLVLEREETAVVLRRVCESYGDLDWDPGLHLGDVIERHLERHLKAANRAQLKRERAAMTIAERFDLGGEA